jgi:hypothetical protein
MYIPKHIKDLLDKTVNLAYDNDRDVPERDRMNALDDYETVLAWLSSLETPPAADFDEEKAVEVGCTIPKPGDLFRPVTADNSHKDSDWKRFLGGEMTPNETWYFAMAYGDPETGGFEDIHFVHDSDWVEILTLCRVCEEEQATGELPRPTHPQRWVP